MFPRDAEEFERFRTSLTPLSCELMIVTSLNLIQLFFKQKVLLMFIKSFQCNYYTSSPGNEDDQYYQNL